MKIVGLTGGIACGKSATSSLFRQEGFTVIDCDALAAEVVQPGRWGYKRVVAAFGQDIILPNGEIDRELLGKLVFSDRALRKKLNKVERLMQRNHYTREEAQARVGSQMPLSKKVELADVLIDNNGTLQELAEQVHETAAKLNSNALFLGLVSSPYACFVGFAAIVVTLALQA